MDDRVRLETAVPPVAERRTKELVTARSLFQTGNAILFLGFNYPSHNKGEDEK